jgi:hypothetical protein
MRDSISCNSRSDKTFGRLACAIAVAVCNAARSEGPGSYLILASPELRLAADAWARYRAAEGWAVTTIPVRPELDSETARREARERIRAHASDAATRGCVGQSCLVLILGDAEHPGGVPTWHVPQPDPSLRAGDSAVFATDEPYQCLDDGDHVPDLALGRVPARSVEEAMAVLEKVRRYERRETDGDWQRRLTFVAGEGRFGPADQLLESLFVQMVDRCVPPLFDIRMTYAKSTSIYCPPPSALTRTILDELGRGSLLFNYIGHGHAERLDSLRWGDRQAPMLSVSDLAGLDACAVEDGAMPIALLTCCSAGWFDLPGERRCLAEAMLLHPRGPIAVIAGSRPTHPYANALHQHRLTRVLLGEQVETIGRADHLAARALLEVDEQAAAINAIAAPLALAMRWSSTLAELRAMHTGLYNLLGDPALRIAYPRAGVTDLKLDDRTVLGRVPSVTIGRAHVTLETLPAESVDSDRIIAVTASNDPNLESKATRNYALANHRLIARHEGDIRNGVFRVDLSGEVPRSGAIIKVTVEGTDEHGRPIEAAGAIRVPAHSNPAR